MSVAGSGAEAYLGWAAQSDPETTPSSPAGGFIPVIPDQISLAYNNGRDANHLALGSLYSAHSIKQGSASSGGSITVPWFQNIISTFLAAMGLGGGPITKPGYVALFWGQVVDEEIFGGQRLKQAQISGDSSKGWEIKLDYDGTQPSVFGSIHAPTAYSDEEQLEWQDFGPANLIVNQASIRLDKLMLTLDFPMDPFHGNHGKPTPSQQTPTGIDVTGSFTIAHDDHTEAASFNAACGKAGPMSFIWQPACEIPGSPPTPADVTTITLFNAFYTKRASKTPLRGTVTEDYDFKTLRVNAGTGADSVHSPCTWVTAAPP